MDVAIQQRHLYLAFLDEVPILSVLSDKDRMQLADALTPIFYEASQVILREGSRKTHDENCFYIISDGEVKCTQHGHEVRACEYIYIYIYIYI